MGSSDYSGDDGTSEVILHPGRIGADPTEGWRRGARGHLRKSCDTCTASKTKCCGSIPCDRCKKKGIECKFSKRLRCGPKARTMDEKRHRTGPSDDSDDSCNTPESRHQPAPHYPPVSAMALNGTNNINDFEHSNGNMAVNGLRVVHGSHRNLGFNAPLTADGLSGLVDWIAPSLSDGGGSGSSASGSCMEPAYRAAALSSLPGTGTFHQQQAPMSFLGEGASPPQHGGGGGVGREAAMSIDSKMDQNQGNQGAPSVGGDAPQKQTSLRSLRPLLSMHSAPSLAVSLPPRDMQPRAKSASAMSISGEGPFAESDETEFLQGGGDDWMGEQRGTESQYSGEQQKRSPVRGKLPMTLAPRPKAHLRVFMRSMGSVVLLPGAEALREASRPDSGDGEEGEGGGGGSPARKRNKRYDSMDDTEDDDKQQRPPVSRRCGSSGEEEGEDDDDHVVNVLSEACKAEAWAAVAVGSLFCGAGDEEAKGYVARSLQALSRCLDASLPEVASVMLLLSLFWMHSMDRRKVMRYFGFAQQVGLDLGASMPEGLRHTIAFVSVLVTIILDQDQASSFGVHVRDPAMWGVTARNRPGGDPFVWALSAATIALSRMVQDSEARRCKHVNVNGVMRPTPPPTVLPSQALTNALSAAAEAVGTVGSRDGDQVPDHMLALLHGLKGLTHAMRDETDEAEASARLVLEVVDRHPAVIHLPLTFTLAEASRRRVDAGAGRNGRNALHPPHIEALRVARAGLVFARPGAERVASGAAGKGAIVRQRKGGGWCAFGDEIFAAFARAGSDAGGGLSPQAAVQGEPSRPTHSRAGSMSPPPGRVTRPRVGWTSSVQSHGRSTVSRSWRVPSPASPQPTVVDVKETDWMGLVRNPPTASRPSSPGIVRPLPPGERPSPSNAGLLGAGPMPPSGPRHAGRPASEPVRASPFGLAVPMPRLGMVGVAVKSDRGSGGDDDNSDDLPPPLNPKMGPSMSFDPNREDKEFQNMVFSDPQPT